MTLLFLHTFQPPSTFSVGGFGIRFYGVAIALGILAGYFVAHALAKRRGLSPDDLAGLLLWLIPLGLVGGRLYHVVNEWWYYRVHLNEILAVWNGGLAIHGAILVGLVTTLLWTRRKRLSFWAVTDVLAPAAAIGQTIGRWGNFFNQELYGKPTDLPWGIPIDLAHRLTGYEAFTHFHPLFLYESFLNLVLFFVLFGLIRRTNTAVGVPTAWYLIGYSAIRFSLDFLRLQQVGFGWLTLAQVVSIILAGLGVALLVKSKRSPKSKTAVA